MDIRDVLFFDKMIVPKLIQLLYWFLLGVVVLGGLVTMFTQSFLSGLLAILVGPLFVRIWCEMIIVMFKMNEALQAIRNK